MNPLGLAFVQITSALMELFIRTVTGQWAWSVCRGGRTPPRRPPPARCRLKGCSAPLLAAAVVPRGRLIRVAAAANSSKHFIN